VHDGHLVGDPFTNSMSCSITIMARPLQIRLSNSAVSSRSRTLMPAMGSSSISSSGSCITTCRSPAIAFARATASRLRCRADLPDQSLRPRPAPGSSPHHCSGRTRRQTRRARAERDFEILKLRSGFRRWKASGICVRSGGTIWYSASFVISSFLNLMLPALARVLPQIRSSSVVLPHRWGNDHAQLVLIDVEVRLSMALKPSNETVRSSTDRTKSSVAHGGSPGLCLLADSNLPHGKSIFS